MSQEHFRKIVAKNLAKIRKERGLTQGQLAEILDYSSKSISSWERGESEPDLETLFQISKFYDLPTDYFLNEHKYDKYSTSAIKKQIKLQNSIFSKELLTCLIIIGSIWLLGLVCFIPMLVLKVPVSYLSFLYCLVFTFVPLIPYGIKWRNFALILSSEIIFGMFFPITLFLSCYYWSNQTVDIYSLSAIFLIIIPFIILFGVLDYYYIKRIK